MDVAQKLKQSPSNLSPRQGDFWNIKTLTQSQLNRAERAQRAKFFAKSLLQSKKIRALNQAGLASIFKVGPKRSAGHAPIWKENHDFIGE